MYSPFRIFVSAHLVGSVNPVTQSVYQKKSYTIETKIQNICGPSTYGTRLHRYGKLNAAIGILYWCSKWSGQQNKVSTPLYKKLSFHFLSCLENTYEMFNSIVFLHMIVHVYGIQIHIVGCISVSILHVLN